MTRSCVTALLGASVATSVLAPNPAEIDGALEAILAGGRDRLRDLTSEDRAAFLAQLLSAARMRRALERSVPNSVGDEAERLANDIPCPEHGAGVGSWTTDIERHHYTRHRFWATDMGFCQNTGLWTDGCGVMCPLRAAVVGTAVNLGRGHLVLDVGSACGHMARWFFDWFGARTFGVDFLEEAVAYASSERPGTRDMKFCWADIAAGGLASLPARRFHLATAISVLHYLRTDTDLYEWAPNASRSSCTRLADTARTQCRAAREMFGAVRIGGYVWISHNGSYKGKWDPRRVWGRGYWRCCFQSELRAGEVEIQEVPELELLLHSPEWDPTYSVVLRRMS